MIRSESSPPRTAAAQTPVLVYNLRAAGRQSGPEANIRCSIAEFTWEFTGLVQVQMSFRNSEEDS